MPLGRRRKSVQGDRIAKECIGNRMTVDQRDDLSEDKSNKGGNKGQEQSLEGVNIVPKQSETPTPGTSSQPQEKKIGHIGAVTRSRVVKRPKRDLSPPESPVKKTATKEVKINTPETKTKRQWELWSTEDKETFFEGLFEHGKDFDAIQNVIAQKCKKKGVAPQLIKNKDQVRHFYYRTWHKICKFVQIEEAVKKETAELYGLINYGVLWKKHKAALTEKNGLKLDELVHTGTTTIKLKGKNLRIKTPCCNALKKLNNIEDSKVDEPKDKLPDRILVELSPKTNAAWAFVQEMSQNPRLRMMLKPQRRLSSIVGFLCKKWKPHRLKLKEDLQGENESRTELTVFPHPECDVHPISLKATKVPQVHVAFNNFRENLLCSPSTSKGKKSDGKVPGENSSEIPSMSVIFDSPRSSKGYGTNGHCVSGSIDVSAYGDGDNAMFPDEFVSSSGVSDSAERQSQPSSDETGICEKTNSPVGTDGDHCTSADSEKSPDSDAEDKETLKLQELIEKGWTKYSSENLSIAELYLMCGKDGKIRLEYDWCPVEINQTEKLTNMLRRLVHLAATEFTDFSKTSNTNSPCHSCGAVKSKSGGKNDTGARSNKTLGKYPLISKMGDGLMDASTQTQGSLLQSTKTENSKDAVFRVPVASPAFLQKNTKPTQINLSQMDLLSNSQRTRRMRQVNRKPMVVHRTLLPKASPRQMFTYVPNVAQVSSAQTRIIGQPIGIPINLSPSAVSTNVIKVPNSNLPGNSLKLISTPVAGAELRQPQSSSSPQSSSNVLPLPIKPGINIQTCQVSATSTSILSTSLPIKTSPTRTSPLSVSTSTPALIHSSISPPSISSLLDISLSNLPPSDPDGTDKFLDLALENSNNFGSLLEATQDKPSSVLNTPVKNANVWMNGEEACDVNFMSLLTDSPLKRVPESTNNGNITMSGLIPSTTFFCENSRDSMMGRLDIDMQSMMNENSIDYVAKFADLAAHITQNDPVNNSTKKSNDHVHSMSRFDELTDSVCVSTKKTNNDRVNGNSLTSCTLTENGNGMVTSLKKEGSSDLICTEDEAATMKLLEISENSEIMDTSSV